MPPPSALSMMAPCLRYWLLSYNLVHGSKGMAKCKSQYLFNVNHFSSKNLKTAISPKIFGVFFNQNRT